MSVDLDAITELAGRDRRAARQLIDAHHAQQTAQARIAADDAAAVRHLHLTEQRQRLAAQERTTRRREAAQATTERTTRTRERAAHRRAARAAAVAYLRGHADDVYAAAMYLLAVGGAVYGQVTAATGRGWPLLAGVVIAVAIEGLALVMALTAQQLRLAGEAARAPRTLTWICAATAAAVNYLGHARTDRVGAALLAVLSVAGIVVWEIRSGAAHRAELRRRGLLPDPPATFGWRRWCRYLPSTAAAWSIDVRDRVSPRGAQLLDLAAAERRGHTTDAERAQVRRLARRSVRAANRRGDSHAALASLRWLAEHGTAGGLPDLAHQLRTETGPDPDPASSPAARTRRSTDKGPDRGPAQDRTRSSMDPPLRPDLEPRPDPGGAAHDGPPGSDPPGPGGAPTGRAGTPAARSAGPPPTSALSGPRPALDVSDLLEAGRRVRDQLAARDLTLSRSVLIRALRADHIPVSTDRAGALLAVLRTDPMPPVVQPEPDRDDT